MTSLQTRWETAIATAIENGCDIAEVAGDCCGSCTNLYEYGVDPDGPMAWSAGFQGKAYEWIDGAPYFYEDKIIEITEPHDYADEDEYEDWEPEEEFVHDLLGPAKRIAFNHDHGGAEILVAAFTAQGFAVDWDGDESTTVYINL